MENNKTAVEFLNERFIYIKWMRDRDEISSETGTKWYNEALEQAKEMEKEQIMDAYDAGLFDGTMDDVNDRLYKQYYNEQYEK